MSIWLNRELFVSPIYYGLCTSEKQFTKTLKALKIPKAEWPSFVNVGANATTHHFEASNGSKSAVICIQVPKGKTVSQIVGLLAHEAVHIWQEIKKSIGEKEPSSEFEAYSVQWLTQCLVHKYFKKKGGKK